MRRTFTHGARCACGKESQVCERMDAAKAVVYKAPYRVAVENVADPQIQKPYDVVVKITSTAIYGFDLHMYEGRTTLPPGTMLGHENLRIIAEVGPGVETLKVGDRVVVPFNVSCGHCENCN